MTQDTLDSYQQLMCPCLIIRRFRLIELDEQEPLRGLDLEDVTVEELAGNN